MIKTELQKEIPLLLQKITPQADLSLMMKDENFHIFMEALRSVDAFSMTLIEDLPKGLSNKAVSLLRRLRSAYALPAGQFFILVRQLAEEIIPEKSEDWQQLSETALHHTESNTNISKLLLQYSENKEVIELLNDLEVHDPHAIYPTSPYRTSTGKVNSNENHSHIEAVMSTSTMTEIHIEEGILDHDNTILRDLYKPLGKCICVIDSNVQEYFGDEVIAYFEHHNIEIKPLVYRAMEIDKGIHMVEKLLADFKRLGVSRQEPVLIVGGGVIADIGGLACALYHRNTPYVMLATSIVSGIDAGPSPRTCCDGFGFKNLFGSYHAPVLTLTDRTFFKTLRTGWIRHGVAEIIKMASVKNEELFDLLEETGIELVNSQFGLDTDNKELSDKANRILALSMCSYVEAEYDNLYETHQCRPHAFGHTWSPGYEIPSGMLHGHAVGCGMGFGAHLSYLQGWISEEERDRILKLISDFELSLWHPILDDTELIYKGQVKVIEKRGGNLVAPLPKGKIGECGYLNRLTFEELQKAMAGYKAICETYPRQGLGVESHCSEVGLEDPSTVAYSPLLEAEMAKV
ncbi:MAG: sedoheptulose 7-phosphate cyclase [Bacteroidota bacterium]